MKFDFEENLKERLEKPEYNTEISLDEILKKVKYPSTPPSLENKGFPPDVYFDCEADEVLTTLENFINQNTKFKSPSLSHLQKYDKQPFEADITK